jgi:tetratricopeptide (TPR) repeat protein
VLYDTAAVLERLNRYLGLFPEGGDMHNVMAATLKREYEDPTAALPHARRCYELSPLPGHYRNLTDTLDQTGDAAAIAASIDEYRARDIGGDPQQKEEALAVAELNLAEARGDAYSDLVARYDRLIADGRMSDRRSFRAEYLFLAGRLREAGDEAEAAAGARRQAAMKTGQETWPPDYGLLWAGHRRVGKTPALAPQELAHLEANLGEPSRFAVLALETGDGRTLASLVRHHEQAEKENMNPGVVGRLHFARACLALIEGRAPEAVALVAPLAGDNDIQRYHHVLGRAQEAAGNPAEAARAYEVALRNIRIGGLDPPAIFVLDQHRLGRLYERLGNTERARYWYGRFLVVWKDADPGTPEVEDAKRRLAALGRAPRETS